jgi:hypothetical protein
MYSRLDYKIKNKNLEVDIVCLTLYLSSATRGTCCIYVAISVASLVCAPIFTMWTSLAALRTCSSVSSTYTGQRHVSKYRRNNEDSEQIV